MEQKERIRFKKLAIDDYDYCILNDASFTLKTQEIVAFVGLMNSGIKAMEKLFEGECPVYRGEVILEGKKVRCGSPEELISNGIYCVNGKSRLNERMSLQDNLFMGSARKGLLSILDYKAQSKEIDALLKRYGLDLAKDLSELNAFEKMKLEIVKCIHHNAGIIVFSDLAQICNDDTIVEFVSIMKDLKERGITVIYMMDDFYGKISKAFDRVIVFRRGCSSTVIDDPDIIRSYEQIVHAIFGREFIKRSEQKVTEINKDNHLLLKNEKGILLEAYGGEIIGIVDNGRLTSMNSHVQIMKEILKDYDLILNGKEVSIHEMKDFVRQRIALIIKEKSDHLVIDNLSVADNVSMLTLIGNDRRFMYEKGVSEYLYEQVTEKYPILKHCRDLYSDDCFDLNYEQKFEIMLARWLAIHPDVVILFWPLGNNDTKNAERYWDLACDLSEQGKIVIVIADSYRYFDEGNEKVYMI
ncbi:MAG: sugar ABC transporter ATP-binding protein [Erysipelotrichaceae bacterium]|nr:sugar ABC transporter ATP-binding protein [Erysipelotrichaceae bacterium]